MLRSDSNMYMPMPATSTSVSQALRTTSRRRRRVCGYQSGRNSMSRMRRLLSRGSRGGGGAGVWIDGFDGGADGGAEIDHFRAAGSRGDAGLTEAGWIARAAVA